MSAPCTYAVAAKIVALDGTTVLLDLNDRTNGYAVVNVTPLDENLRREVVTSPYVDGRFEVSSADDGGTYGVVVEIRGTTWSQMETRREAMRTAYRSAPEYLLDVVIEGVTTRYRANRPDVTSGPVVADNLIARRRSFLLSFPVQPNPTVTGA